MMEVFNKFVIEDGNLVIAKCSYHNQLVHRSSNKDIRGGLWMIDRGTNTVTLYGSSDQFGMATMEAIKECIDKGEVYTNKYSTHSIADKYNFNYEYWEGSEQIIINLKTL